MHTLVIYPERTKSKSDTEQEGEPARLLSTNNPLRLSQECEEPLGRPHESNTAFHRTIEEYAGELPSNRPSCASVLTNSEILDARVPDPACWGAHHGAYPDRMCVHHHYMHFKFV